jgi:hypothetical protein
MEFAWFSVPDYAERHSLETGLLSTIVQCEECGPSKTWLGLGHQTDRVRNSGLWNVHGNASGLTSVREVTQLKLGKRSAKGG